MPFGQALNSNVWLVPVHDVCESFLMSSLSALTLAPHSRLLAASAFLEIEKEGGHLGGPNRAVELGDGRQLTKNMGVAEGVLWGEGGSPEIGDGGTVTWGPRPRLRFPLVPASREGRLLLRNQGLSCVSWAFMGPDSRSMGGQNLACLSRRGSLAHVQWRETEKIPRDFLWTKGAESIGWIFLLFSWPAPGFPDEGQVAAPFFRHETVSVFDANPS